MPVSNRNRRALGLTVGAWSHRAGLTVMLTCAMAALAVLLLPLVLALLMMLFDHTAHGVLVLLGWMLGWLRAFLLGTDSGAPLFIGVAIHPWRAALGSALRSLSCLLAVMLILFARKPGGLVVANRAALERCRCRRRAACSGDPAAGTLCGSDLRVAAGRREPAGWMNVWVKVTVPNSPG